MSLIKSTKDNDLFPSFVTDFFNSDKFFGPGKWFEKEFEAFMPAVNIKENEKHFNIELAAPGFEKTDFKIHVEGDLLNISAEKKRESEDKNERFTRREYNYNSFARSFTLPANAEAEHIEATYDKGILGLKIQKKVETQVSGKKEIKIS
jgi:HSP20 family protein